MKKKFIVNIMLITSMLLVLLVNGCTNSVSQNNSKAIFSNPDKIILYNLGKSKEVKKGDKEFKEIIKLTNDRIDIKKLAPVKDKVSDEIITGKKGRVLAVEFIYDNEQKLSVTGDGFSPIKYNKLFFELFDVTSSAMSGGPGHTVFQYGDSSHFKGSSMGLINESEELNAIVKSIVK
jgi:hypothetical protein